MEVVREAAPPQALVERAVRAGASALVWLRSEPFAVRCEPARKQGQLKLVVAIEGHGVVRQAGRRAELDEGTFAWVDSDAPFELAMTRGRRLLLQLPHDVVRRRHPEIDLRTAVSRGRDHVGERVVAELLRQLAQEASLSADSCAIAANVVLEAVGMCARTVVVDPARARIARALAFIELRLGDPSLQPLDVAREQRVSRRYLDELFQRGTGRSLAIYIRSRRLERAAEDLESRPDDLTAEVASRWGFRDASHFTRVFRGRYAVTPTEYRRVRAGASAG